MYNIFKLSKAFGDITSLYVGERLHCARLCVECLHCIWLRVTAHIHTPYLASILVLIYLKDKEIKACWQQSISRGSQGAKPNLKPDLKPGRVAAEYM